MRGGRPIYAGRQQLRQRFAGIVPVAGLVLMAASLLTAWLRAPLEPARTAWSLPIDFTSLPSKSAASLGAAVAICLAIGAAAVLSGRVKTTPLLAIAGAGAVLVPIFFVVQTVISDQQLLSHLTSQLDEYKSITNQFGYPVPRNQLSSILVVPLSGPWQLMISSLRPGWYFSLIGGLLLLFHAAPAAIAWARRRQLWAAVVLAAVALALVASIGRGIAANELVASAGDSLQSGDYTTALSRLDLAEHLNAEVRSDPVAALVRGQALGGKGDQTSSLALLYIATLRESSHDEIRALEALKTAAASDPNNDVVIASLLDEARTVALQRNDPGILQGIIQHPYGDHIAERYELGRILYSRSDFYTARAQMLATAAMSGADANVASSAHTYIALCDMRLGDGTTERRELLAAIHLDTQYVNSVARALAAGLYISGSI